MIQDLQNLFSNWHLPEKIHFPLAIITIALGVILLSLITNRIYKQLIASRIGKLIKKTNTLWDDMLLKHRFFDQIGKLIPPIFIFLSAPLFESISLYISRFALCYLLVIGNLIIFAFLDATIDIYKTSNYASQRPITGYIQVLKIFLSLVAIILAISVLLDQSPLVLLGGLSAFTAVIMLVFQDTILGFVASIQFTMNNMVQIGDWIEMPKFGADGSVIDVTVTSVKVQNWDKTITTIPTYSMISDSFKNWRGMEESGGRRIKRALYIDINSVEFLSDQQLEKLRNVRLLSDYLIEKEQEIAVHNKNLNVSILSRVNGRHLTNLGTFRAYMLEYLKNHPKINQEMTLLVRHLPPTENGIPIEIYAFCNDQVWANYESIQADIFDHFLAIMPEFNLRAFQAPSGYDLKTTIKSL
jgi:miniconductance mechanosensitive channel